MASTIDNIALTQYYMTFQNAYQDSSKLRNTVQRFMTQRGNILQVPVIGESVFLRKVAPGALIPQSDTAFSQIPITYTAWSRLEAIDVTQQAEVQQDLMTAIAREYALGMGRREDQIIIDAITDTLLDAGNTITSAGNLTVDKIVQAATILDMNGVPDGDRYLALTAEEIRALMKIEQATSDMYVNFNPLMAGTVNNFFGFNIIKIANRREGGLPVVDGTRVIYAWHKSAMGLAYNVDPRVDTNYSVERTSDVAVGVMSAGAAALQKSGIVSINIDTTA